MARGRIKTTVAAIVAISVVLVLAGYGWWRHRYPYGRSHCCDLALYMALAEYAAKHDGAFPAGEATPEASLSLLHRGVPWVEAELLRGKSVPESVVQDVLDRGELLGPDTCGWHYVEGLRIDDDPRLALFWDKEGLDHWGRRLSYGDHIVLRISGEREYIGGTEWAAFVAEQERLLAERDSVIRADAKLKYDGTELRVQWRIMDGCLYGRAWRQGQIVSRETVAVLEGEPSSIKGLPVVTHSEIENAEVVVDRDKGRVRFLLGKRVIVFNFDGLHFYFE